MSNDDEYKKGLKNGTQDTYIKVHNDDIKTIFRKLDKLSVDVAALKVKAGLWGAVGGGLAAAIPILYILLRGL